MTRRWDKYGNPEWVEPMTEEEYFELEAYALSGQLPFARLPAKADRTNVTPFPLLRRKLRGEL